MNPFSPFGMPGMPPIDPSQMDPKLLMELSQLIQQLPPEKLAKIQTLMHNAQAGFDVRQEMAEFEQGLPPGFREKAMAIFGQSGAASAMPVAPLGEDTADAPVSASEGSTPEMNVREARMTILRAVADGSVAPEEAERLLFG